MSANESILLIGAGSNSYRLNSINKVTSRTEALRYGESSQLYKAYTDISNLGAASNLYMLNMIYDTDYPEIIDSLVQNDFTYIVPINIKFSDKIYLTDKKKKVYYPEYLLSNINDKNLSTIIMTDNHASYYEDIDSFINTMETHIRNFKKTSIAINTNGRDLCFIANNLEDYSYANVVVACMLVASAYKDYPLYDCGEAIFDIDYHDVSCSEFGFFKYNIKRSATLENFNNFSTANDQDKFVPINRVLKYIQRYLDLSEFSGRLYNGYLKVLMVNKLNNLLSALVGNAITSYSIISCDFVKNIQTKTISVLNSIAVTPINSLEKYNLLIEVNDD